jgi:hypothetical protein
VKDHKPQNKINTADRYAPADFFVPEALRASGTPG